MVVVHVTEGETRVSPLLHSLVTYPLFRSPHPHTLRAAGAQHLSGAADATGIGAPCAGNKRFASHPIARFRIAHAKCAIDRPVQSRSVEEGEAHIDTRSGLPPPAPAPAPRG